MQKILIIEDDISLAMGICMALKSESITTEACDTISKAKQYISQKEFDLLILDINLPDGNGIEFLKECKAISDTPIILLTANDMETDIVLGLESGADDYMTKPFSLAVLRARVHTQLRKKQTKTQMKTIIDGFIFDFDHMEYHKNGTEIELSKTEQKLLKMLVSNRGRTLQRGYLVDRIWADGADYVDENALSVTIKRLRNKLEDTPSKPKYIKTVYGIGYTWEGTIG